MRRRIIAWVTRAFALHSAVMSCVLVGVCGEGIEGVFELILDLLKLVMWHHHLSRAAVLELLSSNSRLVVEGGTAGAVAVLRSMVEVVAESSKMAEGVCRLVEVVMAEVTRVVVSVRVEGGSYVWLSTADFWRELEPCGFLGCHGEGS